MRLFGTNSRAYPAVSVDREETLKVSFGRRLVVIRFELSVTNVITIKHLYDI